MTPAERNAIPHTLFDRPIVSDSMDRELSVNAAQKPRLSRFKEEFDHTLPDTHSSFHCELEADLGRQDSNATTQTDFSRDVIHTRHGLPGAMTLIGLRDSFRKTLGLIKSDERALRKHSSDPLGHHKVSQNILSQVPSLPPARSFSAMPAVMAQENKPEDQVHLRKGPQIQKVDSWLSQQKAKLSRRAKSA